MMVFSKRYSIEILLTERKRKMKKRTLFLILLTVMLISACTPQETTPEAEVKTDLTMGYTTEPEGLDPHRTAAASTFAVTNNIYDTLVGVTPDWQIVPRLAEKWVLSDDGMEITFALRDDVYFHNGRQMTAKDVEYSFNRLKDAESPRARDYINIVKIEVLSDYEIKFTTETLDVELLKSFVYPWAAVVPEEDVANLKTKPVGTGAFILEEWVPQQHLTLRRNDNYYGDEVKIETVKLVLIPDATSMMAGFQVGNLDIIPLTGDQVTMVEGNENFKVLSEPMNAVQIMSLNTKNQYLSNEKVRQAMAMAINKAEVLLSKVGFKSPKTVLNYYPWQLSGGMRQRCNIAMALMNDPKLIIADEPTTALDTTVQKQVMELFKSINEEMKLSILLISHDLGLVKRYSHSLGVMYAGQIVESGCTETVFNEPGHPYTRLLIKIIPSLKMKKNEPLTEIPGFVKDKDRDSKGCLFYCRCPKAMDICKEGVKEHTDDTGDHYYRCNLE
jgi:oligopeptide/dipeptide ABC transporter ATP-binding protein